jgi:hypothetical protein
MPGLIDYTWRYYREDGQTYIEELQHVGVSFLGYEAGFEYLLKGTEEFSGDSYTFSWTLKKSIDGKFKSLDGGWYLKAVEIDGVPYTYMRYTNTGVMELPFPGFPRIMELFAPINTVRLFKAIAAASADYE